MNLEIKNIMSIVFDIEESKITEDITMDELDQWDSLKHINLIMALEREYQVVFDEDEIVEMLSFQKIEEMLKSKLNKVSSDL